MAGNQIVQEEFSVEEVQALHLMAASHLLARRQPLPPGGPTVMCSYRLPRLLQAELRRVAAERGTTATDAVQQAIRAWLAVPVGPPRNAGDNT